MGCGFSRDDAGRFLKHYVQEGIYDYDPFQVLDREGVGELVRIAVAHAAINHPKRAAAGRKQPRKSRADQAPK